MNTRILIIWLFSLTTSAFGTGYRVDNDGVISNGQYSILVFHNHYPVGKQSGIELIRDNQRLASNGTLVVHLKNGNVVKAIDNGQRNALNDSTVILGLEAPGYPLSWSLHVQASNNRIGMKAIPHQENNVSLIKSVHFEMDFYSGCYAGKTFMTEDDCGMLPYDYLGGTYLKEGTVMTRDICRGSQITLAPEDPRCRLHLSAGGQGRLALLDGRYNHFIQWFRVRTMDDQPEKEVLFEIGTIPQKGSIGKPRLIVPETGYHPQQPKDVVIEMDTREDPVSGKLYRLLPSGEEEEVLSAIPEYWGKYYRYHYWKFRFDQVTGKGLYRFACNDSVSTGYFLVSDGVYDQVWQPTITCFMPVQMCHMRVTDRSHIWHGACHLDDGLQAPVDWVHFDGYRQGADTDTPFTPETTIPGMNAGGWHDAGDDDIHITSNSINLYSLALALEEFGFYIDETTIDFSARNVTMNVPDGENDALQQIIHGLNWILPQYEQCGHSIRGVISNSRKQYSYTGDWASATDNLFYDPSLPVDSATSTHSGRHDDRYVFTNSDWNREYFVAAVLSSCSRVLAGKYPSLAKKCLLTAGDICRAASAALQKEGENAWTTEHKIGALVELYLSTADPSYLEQIVEDEDKVFHDFEKTAWTLSRVIDNFENRAFVGRYLKRLEAYATVIRDSLARSPFGTVDRNQVWGVGWEIQWCMYKHYFLIKRYPDLFPETAMYDGLNYQLGRHPGGSVSLVSGVGSRQPIPAFGINRDDMHYIPGGVFSGPAKINPGFFELKEDTPYIWQQTEYIISGAGPYVFMVWATRSLLENYMAQENQE